MIDRTNSEFTRHYNQWKRSQGINKFQERKRKKSFESLVLYVAFISIFESTESRLPWVRSFTEQVDSSGRERRGIVWMAGAAGRTWAKTWCYCCCLEIVSRHERTPRRRYASMRRGRDWRASRRGGGKGEPVDSKLGCHDARISAEKRQDFRIVALHTERPILFSRFEMWVAARLYVGIVVSLFFCRFFLCFSLFLSLLSSFSIPFVLDGRRLIFRVFREA